MHSGSVFSHSFLETAIALPALWSAGGDFASRMGVYSIAHHAIVFCIKHITLARNYMYMGTRTARCADSKLAQHRSSDQSYSTCIKIMHKWGQPGRKSGGPSHEYPCASAGLQ